MKFELAFEIIYCVRNFNNSSHRVPDLRGTTAERTLTKLGFDVWDLNKLLIRRAESVIGLIWVKKMIGCCVVKTL